MFWDRPWKKSATESWRDSLMKLQSWGKMAKACLLMVGQIWWCQTGVWGEGTKQASVHWVKDVGNSVVVAHRGRMRRDWKDLKLRKVAMGLADAIQRSGLLGSICSSHCDQSLAAISTCHEEIILRVQQIMHHWNSCLTFPFHKVLYDCLMPCSTQHHKLCEWMG